MNHKLFGGRAPPGLAGDSLDPLGVTYSVLHTPSWIKEWTADGGRRGDKGLKGNRGEWGGENGKEGGRKGLHNSIEPSPPKNN